MLEQRERLGHGEVGTMAVLGHQFRPDRIEQVLGRGQVIGQRHQRVGAAGENHHGGLCILAQSQQVEHLVPGMFQAGRLQVAGEHRGCHFQQHHQRRGAFQARLFQLLPAWPEQGEPCEQPCAAQRQPGQPAVANATAGQQRVVEGDGKQALPASLLALAMPEVPQQPQWQRQDQ